MSKAELNRLWDRYTAEAGEAASAAGFGAWLVLMGEEASTDGSLATHPIFQRETDDARQRGQASYLLARLHRLLRQYMKPVIHEHGIATADDFGFLATIHVRGQIGKAQLCEHAAVEITTGMDVIRRLRTAGLVKESVNPADRREKLLSLTAAGSKKLHALFKDLDGLPDVFADLPAEARALLLRWLARLDHFHTAVQKGGEMA